MLGLPDGEGYKDIINNLSSSTKMAHASKSSSLQNLLILHSLDWNLVPPYGDGLLSANITVPPRICSLRQEKVVKWKPTEKDAMSSDSVNQCSERHQLVLNLSKNSR